MSDFGHNAVLFTQQRLWIGRNVEMGAGLLDNYLLTGGHVQRHINTAGVGVPQDGPDQVPSVVEGNTFRRGSAVGGVLRFSKRIARPRWHNKKWLPNIGHRLAIWTNH